MLMETFTPDALDKMGSNKERVGILFKEYLSTILLMTGALFGISVLATE